MSWHTFQISPSSIDPDYAVADGQVVGATVAASKVNDIGLATDDRCALTGPVSELS